MQPMTSQSSLRAAADLLERHRTALLGAAAAATILLLAAGGFLVASAMGAHDLQAHGNAAFTLRLHLRHAVLALFAFLAAAFLPVAILARGALALALAGLVGALLLFVPGLGVRSGGALREVAVGSLLWEPGQLLALAMIVWGAFMFSRRPLGVRRRYLSVVVVGLGIVLAVVQPDFSLIPLILAPLALQGWRAGLRGRRAALWALGMSGVVLAAALFQPYIVRRVDAWIEPQVVRYETGRDYLIMQEGVREGGAWGVGYGQGRHLVKTREAHTDYLFAHALEELGWVRGLLLLLLFLPVFLLAVRSWRLPDRFAALLALGMSAYIGTAGVIHVLVSLRLVPVTAIHMPFLSYGATALVTSAVAMGILVSANRASAPPAASIS
jgi:cell division protein FtsW